MKNDISRQNDGVLGGGRAFHVYCLQPFLPPLILVAVLLFVLLIGVVPARSAETAAVPKPDVIRAKLEEVKQQTIDEAVGIDTIAEMIRTVKSQAEKAGQCVEAGQAEIDKLGQTLETLGEETAEEAPEVRQKRQSQKEKKLAREKVLAECRLLKLQAGELQAELENRRNLLARKRFFHRDRDIVELLATKPDLHGQWLREIGDSIVQRHGLTELSPLVMVIGLAVTCSVALSSLKARRLLMVTGAGQKMLQAVLAGLRAYLPFLLPLLTLVSYFQLVTRELPYRSYLVDWGYVLCVYFFLRLLVRIFTRPAEGGETFFDLPPKLLTTFRRYLKLASLLLAVTFFFLSSRSEAVYSPSFLLSRLTVVTLLCLVIIRLIWLIKDIPGRERIGRWARYLVTPFFLATVMAQWLGYDNVSQYLLVNLVKTLGAVLFFICVKHVMGECCRRLSYGSEGWPNRIRSYFGLEAYEVGTSFLWMMLLVNALITVVLFFSIIRIWSISHELPARISDFLVNGFTVGQIPIVPLRIFMGLLLFLVFWTIARWLKNQIRKNIAKETHFSKSARDAFVTISGYFIFGIALILGLAAAGVNFTSLTVIAGALSVGIGFGLQNIINNFVSGLILLFERPIRRGDWIIVSGTEGYVKKISVRSTVISTFDRADVIVPNSELISSQVTNWMLSDRKGRVRVPVGVAYGSDTELVKNLLLETAYGHPDVVTDGSVPEPLVLFMGFGDSSLDFELRCYIKDVDNRLRSRSDLNFAIDAAFRANGVQIPFPQRDVHVRDYPPEGRSEKTGERGEDDPFAGGRTRS